MKKQKQPELKPDVKYCVVFIIKDGNGQELFNYLMKDPKLRPVYHWKQGEWNETTKMENSTANS